MNEDDEHHEQAEAILADCIEGVHGAVLTTADIVDETLTLMLSRGEPWASVAEFAALVGLHEDDIQIATVLDVPRSERTAAWPLFERHYGDRGLSFTDCTSVVAMRRRGIDKIASFDEAFDGLVERVDG